MKPIILPTFLEADRDAFQTKLNIAANTVKRIHIDVIESAFAPNPTLLPEDWSLIDEKLEVDVHLMVEHPEEWLDRCIVAGATTIIGHIEKVKDQKTFIELAIKKGAKAGLAVDLNTPIEKLSQVTSLRPELRPRVHLSQVLLLGVKAGYSGQAFDPRVLEKIIALRQNHGNSAEIIVDGGITLEAARACFKTGATGLAVNTWLWEDFEIRLKKLKEIG